MSLKSNACTELQWWLHNKTTVNGSTINPPAPELYITSDASKGGWGACCQNLTANGRWSLLEAKDLIIVLELKAAFLATKTFLKHHSNITVCLRMDNITAVAHINNKGGTRSPQLVNLTLELWQWCLQKSILITAQHLPGKLNKVADRESRELYDSIEWQIDPQVIQPFLRRCSVDLFASRLTTLLSTYASWKPDPGATYTDAPRLVPSQRLRLSTIQSDRTSTEKSVSGQSRFGLSGPSMAGTTLVASPPEPVNQESCHDPKLQTPAEGPCVPSENPSNVPQASFSRLSVIREQHQTEGFSEDINRILQSATRASTQDIPVSLGTMA